MRFLGRAVAGAVFLALADFFVCIALGIWVGWGSTAAIIAYAVFGVLILAFISYTQLMKINTLYRAAIAARFDEVFNGDRLLEETVDLDKLKVVVLSDQHKGARDGADDFWRCERAYRAALAYYLERGYRLIVLGDAEELWESQPKKVLDKYAGVLALEQRFHRAGRYERVWGNHDIDWSHPRKVERWLSRVFGRDFQPNEGLKIHLTEKGKNVGVIFMTHGHQGTPDSDVFAPISKPFVRFFGLLQKHFNRPWNTPARDWKLRQRHDDAMYCWAEKRLGEQLILIAGHTHRPVFWDRRPAPVDKERIGQLERVLERKTPRRGTLKRATLEAELEYLRGDELWTPDPPEKLTFPCYFNTGCCAFGDGDATGIELEGGQIRLVRFPDSNGAALPQVLARERLSRVFGALDVAAVERQTADGGGRGTQGGETRPMTQRATRWLGSRRAQVGAAAAGLLVAAILVIQLIQKDGQADSTSLALVVLLILFAYAVLVPRQTARIVARITSFKLAGIEVGLTQIAAAERIKPPGDEGDGHKVERNDRGYQEICKELRSKLRFVRLILELEEEIPAEDNYVKIAWQLRAMQLLRNGEVPFILDLVEDRDLHLSELPEATEDEFLDASWSFAERFGAMVWDRYVRRRFQELGWTIADYPQAAGHREDFLAYHDGSWILIAARVGNSAGGKPYRYYRTAVRLAKTETGRPSAGGPTIPISVPIEGRSIVLPAIRIGTVQNGKGQKPPKAVKVLTLQRSLEDDTKRAKESSPWNEDYLERVTE